MSIARRHFLAGLFTCPFCATAAATHWNYDNAGPKEWAGLDPSYKACAGGDQQSPVDLHDGIKAQLPPLSVQWKKEQFKAVNNEHTIQLNATPGSYVDVGATKFNLVQFHFHTPSEHAEKGQRTAMEVHFVHKQDDGRLTVLGALIVPGAPNAAFKTIMTAAPAQPGEQPLPVAIDPEELLPASRESVWRYEGSLTTPPCSQIVDWIVFNQPVEVAASDIECFKKIFPMNARPLQLLERRYLLES